MGLGLHTLQGLHALARIKVPGGVGFFFFFPGKKKKKKNPDPLYPFSQKSVQGVQGVQYPFYHPSSFRELHPLPLPAPFTSSPSEALVLLFSS